MHFVGTIRMYVLWWAKYFYKKATNIVLNKKKTNYKNDARKNKKKTELKRKEQVIYIR